MSYLTEVHDRLTCSSESCPCHEWSQRKTDEAILNDIDEVLMGLSPFAAAWASAPESMKRYCERDIAEHFYNAGRKDEQKRVLDDLKEMNRLVEGRIK